MGIALYLIPFETQVASHLAELGFTSIELKRQELFTFEFEAEKEGGPCKGTVTRSFGRTKHAAYCGVAPERMVPDWKGHRSPPR